MYCISSTKKNMIEEYKIKIKMDVETNHQDWIASSDFQERPRVVESSLTNSGYPSCVYLPMAMVDRSGLCTSLQLSQRSLPKCYDLQT